MPALNATHIIRRSLRLMGAVGRGQPVQAQDATDSLQTLNDMVSAWRTKSLTIPYDAIAQYTLVSGQQTYLLGPAGDWVQPKPTFIRGFGLILNTSVPQTELPMHMYTAQSWQFVTIKTLTSTFPTGVYPQFKEAAVELSFWPVPIEQNDIRIYFPAVLQSFADLTTTYDVQEGFGEALIYNLARRLAPEYGLPLDPDVMKMAAEALANIAGPNQNMDTLIVDRALRRRGSLYDWRTDEGAGGTDR
jgi:hypothetical protein